MKKLITILLVALAHFLLAVFLFISSFRLMLDPDDLPPTLYQKVVAPISTVLLYPLFVPLSKIAPRAFPGLLGYIPMYLNSIIWAIGIVFIRDVLRSKKNSVNNRKRRNPMRIKTSWSNQSSEVIRQH